MRTRKKRVTCERLLTAGEKKDQRRSKYENKTEQGNQREDSEDKGKTPKWKKRERERERERERRERERIGRGEQSKDKKS